MKKKSLFPMLMLGAVLGFFTACSEEDVPETGDPNAVFKNLPADSGVRPTVAEMDAVVANFVDAVAIPTYAALENQMKALKDAVDKFKSNQTQTNLDEACDAWRAARRPWEQSEAFLYGPADLKKLDPSLDSWPLDKTGIEQIVINGDWDKIGGDVIDEGDDTPEDAPQNLRGFHTAEKLLFENGDPRKVETFQTNELTYLQKVVDRMYSDVCMMHKGWTDGLGDTEVPVAYGEAMKKHDGSGYNLTSVYAALELMLNGDNGMAGISNEVGTAKIKDPVDKWKSGDQEGGVLAVESWYSWNSLTDYVDNIRSIKNCYLGGIDGQYNEEKSLSALVKKINPTLDNLIIEQIDLTMEAINDIPHPFRSNLDKDTEITKAMDACSALTYGLGVVRAKLSAENN